MLEWTFLNPKNGLAFCMFWTSFLHFGSLRQTTRAMWGNCEERVWDHVGACLGMTREAVGGQITSNSSQFFISLNRPSEVLTNEAQAGNTFPFPHKFTLAGNERLLTKSPGWKC